LRLDDGGKTVQVVSAKENGHDDHIVSFPCNFWFFLKRHSLSLSPFLYSFRIQVVKVFSVIFGGFLFSLLSTAGSVWGVKRMVRSVTKDQSGHKQQLPPPQVPSVTTTTTTTTIGATPTPPPKAFSDEITYGTRRLAGVGAVAAIVVHRLGIADPTPYVTLSMLGATVYNFCFGARLPARLTKAVHPLVYCTAMTWGWSYLLGAATGTSFVDMIRSYRRGGPWSVATSGAGDVLTFVLGPAVVSLGVSIYERRALIRQNLGEVMTATGMSCLGGLFGTAMAVRLLGLASARLRLSLLPRNITSALAVAIAEIVGADRSLAVSFAILTGLLGANFGPTLLDWFGVRDPVARGLGMGCAAHGLGTAAMVDEKDAFPFAAIGMTLTAIGGTLLVSVPAVRGLALQLAVGGGL
jgi:putative effector of murein hydrolase